jgi:hypothetical protein
MSIKPKQMRTLNTKLFVCLMLFLAFTQCKPSKNFESNFSSGYGKHGNYKIFKNLNLERQPTLPNPLKKDNNGVVSASEWGTQRKYLKKMLTYYQYGKMPGHHDFDSLNVKVEHQKYLFGRYDSTAIQKKLLFTIYHNSKSCNIHVGLIRPLKKIGKLPVIIKNARYVFNINTLKSSKRIAGYRKHRLKSIFRYARQKSVEEGYVFLKFNRDDVAEDHKGNRETGIFPLYPTYSMGTIAAWAWAYSVIIDWLEKQPYIDSSEIVATGHSRGGKTALCAGIYDNRIAITVPNASGAGGTASLRYFAGAVNKNLHYIKSNKRYLDYGQGEDAKQKLAYLKKTFPYWWSKHFFQFVDSVTYMPFDSHFNKMLIAPRALLNTMARQNFWSNPYGTYLTYLAAQPIFDAYGKPVHQAIHWRNGGHNQGPEDWDALFDYCDYIFFNKPLSLTYNQNPYPGRYKYNSILTPYLKYFNNFGGLELKNSKLVC